MAIRSSFPSRRFSPAAAAALGIAAGFYPASLSVSVAFFAAILSAGIGATLASLGSLCPPASRSEIDRARRIRAARCYAFAIGIVAGAAIQRDFPAAPTFTPESGASTTGAIPSARVAPAFPAPLSPTAARGRLVSDSSPIKGRFRSYPMAIEGLELEGGAVRAELTFTRSSRRRIVRVLAKEGPPLDAGGELRVRGDFSADGGAIFAHPRDLWLEEPRSAIDRARSAARRAFREALARVGRSSAGLLEALILGSKEGLSADEAEAFKAAGCAHILALSGEHLSVLALIALAGLKPIAGPFRARLGAAFLATAFMWIAGPGPSLVRAVIMAWIGAFALILDRPLPWSDILSLALLAALPADPESARSLGFILSYLAVLGLALLGPRIGFCLAPFLPPSLAEPAAASLAAQAAVSPVLAFSFGSLQFAGILASIAAGPLVAALMWWGMGTALICSIFPALAPAAAFISDLAHALLFWIMETAAAVRPLLLPGPAERIAACLAVAGFSAFVYARPYADYRSALGRGRGRGSRGGRRA
ncbi:MAG: ComEC/Rec2 family competence protein [Spirochaetaceae bacterium]|nr:ComEC/Rec2 family competence protein [Spirochaetaceae bacterium]